MKQQGCERGTGRKALLGALGILLAMVSADGLLAEPPATEDAGSAQTAPEPASQLTAPEPEKLKPGGVIVAPPTLDEALKPNTSSPLLGGSAQAGQRRPPNCIEIEINDVRTFDCLNEKLETESARIPKVPNIPPFDVRSKDVHLGIVNQSALRQQFGKNYGVSIYPYRPTEVYTGGPKPHR